MGRVKSGVRIYLIIIISLLVWIGGCSNSTSSPPSSMPPLTPPSSSGPTYGSLSQQGQTIFTNICAQCHGANGQGVTAPAIIGTSASLGKYNTAKGLLDFISTAMPLNAPGSLAHQDYINVLCYLLVQNNYAFPGTAYSESALPGLQLK
jgi:hypothetical protein